MGIGAQAFFHFCQFHLHLPLFVSTTQPTTNHVHFIARQISSTDKFDHINRSIHNFLLYLSATQMTTALPSKSPELGYAHKSLRSVIISSPAATGSAVPSLLTQSPSTVDPKLKRTSFMLNQLSSLFELLQQQSPTSALRCLPPITDLLSRCFNTLHLLRYHLAQTPESTFLLAFFGLVSFYFIQSSFLSLCDWLSLHLRRLPGLHTQTKQNQRNWQSNSCNVLQTRQAPFSPIWVPRTSYAIQKILTVIM